MSIERQLETERRALIELDREIERLRLRRENQVKVIEVMENALQGSKP